MLLHDVSSCDSCLQNRCRNYINIGYSRTLFLTAFQDCVLDASTALRQAGQVVLSRCYTVRLPRRNGPPGSDENMRKWTFKRDIFLISTFNEIQQLQGLFPKVPNWIFNWYKLTQTCFERSNGTLVTSQVPGYIYRHLGWHVDDHGGRGNGTPPMRMYCACIIDFDKGQMAEISDLQTR